MDKILVINPNSTEAVTRGIDEACAPLRMPGGPAIECATLKEGPPGIETQQHVDGVVSPLLKLIREEKSYSAYVIACYSDPGLHTAREATKIPASPTCSNGTLPSGPTERTKRRIAARSSARSISIRAASVASDPELACRRPEVERR